MTCQNREENMDKATGNDDRGNKLQWLIFTWLKKQI